MVRSWLVLAATWLVAWVPWLPATAHAQIPPELVGRRVSSVEIAGRAPAATSPRVAGIPIGAPLTRQLLRDSIQRLVASGRWADVQIDLYPEGEGVRLVTRLAPRLLLLRVDVRGNEILDDDELLRELQLGPDVEIEPAQIAELQQSAQLLYHGRGYQRAEIELLLRDTDDPSRKVLRIEIKEGEPTEIAEIVFDGDELPLGSRLLSSMDISRGDILDREQVITGVRAGEQRLRELGYYEARLGPPRFEPVADGVLVRIPTLVGPRYSLRLTGESPLGASEVRDAMELESERLRPASMLAIEQRIVDLYRRRGFLDAQVQLKVWQGTDPQDGILEVRIAPHEPLNIVARAYPGARFFERDFLEEQVLSFLDERLTTELAFIEPVDDESVRLLFDTRVQRRRRSPQPVTIVPSRIYYEPAYEAAAEHLQSLYEADGFLGAEVGPVRVQRLQSNRAVVVVPVREGPRTLLSRVEITGNTALGARELLEGSGLERDMPFSFLKLEQARSRMRELYQDRGYFYAEIETHARFSADRTRAEIQIGVRERYEVHVGELLIRGADRTREQLLRRVVNLDQGSLLTRTGLRQAQERLMALGIFSGVNIAPSDPELPERVKTVEVTVTERLSQLLDFSPGLSTAQGARVALMYGYRNLGGTALTLSARAQFNYQFLFLDNIIQRRFERLSLGERIEYRVTVALDAPFMRIPKVQSTYTGTAQRDLERNFVLDKQFLDATLTWRPLRPLTVAFSADLEHNDVTLFEGESYDELIANTTDPRLRRLLRVPEGETIIIAGDTTLTLDYRDSPFSPTRGFYASATLEYAHTLFARGAREGQDFQSRHLRVLAAASAYAPLGRSVVFATQVQFGRVIHLTSDSQTYPNRQFFLGGVDTLRGYLQDALVPQDLAESIAANPEVRRTLSVVQGGDVMLVVRGELRFPIVGPVRGGLFVDLANTWIEAGQLNPIKLRPTAGLGVRIKTPVGPIAFDYGFLLAPRQVLNEVWTGSFHFSIGLF